MSVIHFRAPLVVAALIVLFSTEASAQAAATGPFAKVPPLLSQYAIMNTSSASYRSTESYEGAHEYMNAAFAFYQHRDEKPRCTAAGCD